MGRSYLGVEIKKFFAVTSGQQKQCQKAGSGMPGVPDVGGRPISLQQARAMFDPGKFYGALRNAGVRGV